MCNFLEYKGEFAADLDLFDDLFTVRGSIRTGVPMCDSAEICADELIDTKVIYRRYASLFFICSVSSSDNELIILETVHRYVECLDRYFGNVSPSPSFL